MLPPRASPLRATNTGPRVPTRRGVAERAVRARSSTVGAPCGAGGVLGLRTDQLAAHAAVHARVARALRERWALRAARPLAGVFVRTGSRRGRACRFAIGGAVSGRARLFVRGLAGVRGARLGGALPVRPTWAAALVPLRRGRLPRNRGGDPGDAARDRPRVVAAAAAHAVAAGGRAGRGDGRADGGRGAAGRARAAVALR